MTPAVLFVAIALVLVIGGFIIASQRAQLPPGRVDIPKSPKLPADLTAPQAKPLDLTAPL